MQPYTVPYDGPAGDMLRVLGRDAWRSARDRLPEKALHAPLVIRMARG
jgi:hypothetical protein